MAIYLKWNSGKVKGDCSADGYKDYIVLTSCNIGMSRGISMTAGDMSNREATRPSITEISCSKEADSSVIALFKEAVSGDAGETCEIVFVRTGADKIEEYQKIEIENTLVSSYSISANGDDTPVEHFTLSFSKILVSYSNTDATLGGGSQQRAGYDVEKGTKL
ncbi:Hcp family type VI secretion system effector [Aliikangiella sp. IMCC44359]|uniref:Hcp family type VI secretion system effector n=1 Tax=Aliikangiella sp. IMCC44359 TaxID=3459125 RepID=UPI00403B2649